MELLHPAFKPGGAATPVRPPSRLAGMGRLDQAHRALKDFQDVVPKAQTVGQIKAGTLRVAPGGDAFWQALREAGAER